jgi:hypothetical protein
MTFNFPQIGNACVAAKFRHARVASVHRSRFTEAIKNLLLLRSRVAVEAI